MKRNLLKIWIVLMLATAPHTSWAADTLFLKNGDKLTGAIEDYDIGTVQIKTKYGLFIIPSADLVGVQSDNKHIERQITRTVSLVQSLAPVSTPQQSEVSVEALLAEAPSVTATENSATEDAATESPAEEGRRLWGAKFTGGANLGAGLRTGNSDTSNINFDTAVNLRWAQHRGEFEANYNREEDDGEVTVQNHAFSIAHGYFFQPQWFIESSAQFEQDEIDRLDLRATFLSGLGYQPYEQDNLNLKFVLSPGYQREEFEDGTRQNNITVQWAMDYNQRFRKDLFRLFHKHELNTPGDDIDAYLFQSESGIRVPVKLGIIASGQIDFDWDNDPAAGTVEDDTRYSIKLGYEW